MTLGFIIQSNWLTAHPCTAETKTELRGMLAEAIRNTQLLPPRGFSYKGRAQE
jgi:hypothetical protein